MGNQEGNPPEPHVRILHWEGLCDRHFLKILVCHLAQPQHKLRIAKQLFVLSALRLFAGFSETFPAGSGQEVCPMPIGTLLGLFVFGVQLRRL